MDPDPPDTPNRAPAATETIPAQTVQVGDDVTLNLSRYFNDPDGDVLTYTARTSDGVVATVSVAGSEAVVTGVAKGDATITVTATDSGGLSGEQNFSVHVPNRPPEPVGTIPDLNLFVGDTLVIDISPYFNDPDGDVLTYTATPSQGAATTTVDGETVTVVAVFEGSASLTVTASDSERLSAQQGFAATVQPRGDPMIQFVTFPTAAPEGGRIVVELEAHPVPHSTLVVGYTIAEDGDPETDDANEADHDGGGGGEVQFQARSGRATFEITVQDDDDIEPTRETFAISLDPPQEGAGYVLGSANTAILTIDEGVCDRTPRVRDALVALTGMNQCHEPDGSHLAAIDTLDLRGPEAEGSAVGAHARSSAATNSVGCGAVTRSDWHEAGPALTSTPASCTSRTFDRAPLMPASYSRSAASDDPITELRAGDFLELTELGYLWLFNNRLKELPAGIFSGLEDLRQLHLDYNRIRELPEGLLSGLSRLEEFYIHENELTRLRPDLFSGLARLREVWLSRNELTELPAELVSDAGDLETLQLWGNRLRALPGDIFSGLVHLKGLDLSGNLLTEIDAAAFSDLTDLERLWLEENRLAELSDGLFANLGNLEILWIRKNRLENLQRGLFDELTNLTTLLADSNRIENLEDGMFSNLSELDELGLQHNRLSELRPGMFSGLGRLETLGLGGNRFASVEPDVFSGLANLEALWLDRSEITLLHPGAFNGLASLTSLVLWGNQLSALPEGVFAGLPLLEHLWIYSNRIEELHEEVFAGLPELKQLVMWGNRLTELPPGVFDGLKELEELYLTGNALAKLPPAVFSSLSALDKLSLLDNNLSELPDGLFEGLFDLDEFSALGNPATPFGLRVQLARRDTADLAAPGPARVVLSLTEGAPFSIRIPLSVDGGTLSADTAVIEQGHTVSSEFTVAMTGSQSGTTVILGPPPPVPDGILGVEVVAADTLVLFTTAGDVSAWESEMAAGSSPEDARRQRSGLGDVGYGVARVGGGGASDRAPRAKVRDRTPAAVQMASKARRHLDAKQVRVEQFTRIDPVGVAESNQMPVSGIGVKAAARIVPEAGEAFIAVSMYARWMQPHPTTRNLIWRNDGGGRLQRD